jgi:hypothetical protein
VQRESGPVREGVIYKEKSVQTWACSSSDPEQRTFSLCIFLHAPRQDGSGAERCDAVEEGRVGGWLLMRQDSALSLLDRDED